MQIIGAFLGILFWSLFGAVLLRAAFKWVMKEDVKFGEAYSTVFITYLINVLLGFGIGVGLGSANASENLIKALPILFMPIGFLIQSAVIASRHKLPFGKACLVSLAIIGVFLGLAIVIGGIIFIIIKAN
jgi:hypothetical protein